MENTENVNLTPEAAIAIKIADEGPKSRRTIPANIYRRGWLRGSPIRHVTG